MVKRKGHRGFYFESLFPPVANCPRVYEAHIYYNFPVKPSQNVGSGKNSFMPNNYAIKMICNKIKSFNSSHLLTGEQENASSDIIKGEQCILYKYFKKY